MLWKIVDAAHYDLNTCLRETIIMLKSFLHVLPDEELPSFQKFVDSTWDRQRRANLGRPRTRFYTIDEWPLSRENSQACLPAAIIG